MGVTHSSVKGEVGGGSSCSGGVGVEAALVISFLFIYFFHMIVEMHGLNGNTADGFY